MKKLLMALVVVAGGLTAGTTLAQDLTPAQQAEAQFTLETARSLVNYGESKGDALALVTAAKMFAEVPGRVLADGATGQSGEGLDIEALLTKAGELAPGDAIISQLSEQVRTLASEDDRALCLWQYYCYGGWCQYYWVCF